MSKASFDLFKGKLIGANLYKALKALSIAEKAHEGVMRNDGVTPYIEHPMKVATLLFETGLKDDTILACAILHDTIEDTNITKSDLILSFGNQIADTVERLSKPKDYDNKSYYQKIQTDPIATLVKLADRAHNLMTLYNFKEPRKERYIRETKEFVYPLIKYAQHTYYECSAQIKIFDLMIESVVKNVEPYFKEE